jgi:hypothetical protein
MGKLAIAGGEARSSKRAEEFQMEWPPEIVCKVHTCTAVDTM